MTPTRNLIRAGGLALGLTALLVTSAVGAHHLEGEDTTPVPKPAKVIVIAPEEFTALVGASRTFWASICNEDGSGCKDAKKAKWSVHPKKGFPLSKKQGVQVLGKGKKAGTYVVTAAQGGAKGSIKVKINKPLPPPSPTLERRLLVIPEEPLVRIGEPFVLTALGCPPGTTLARAGSYAFVQAERRSAADEVADWLEAGCTPQDITEVNPHETIRELYREGNQTLLVKEGETEDFAGVQVQTDIGGTLPSPRDADATECEPLPGLEDVDVDAVLLEAYDVDRDGTFTMADVEEWDRLERADFEEGDPSVDEIDDLLDVDGDGEVGTTADRAELEAFINRTLIERWLESTPADC